jgi:hypothetical protein
VPCCLKRARIALKAALLEVLPTRRVYEKRFFGTGGSQK